MVRDGGPDSDPQTPWQGAPRCVVGFTAESNAESMAGCTGERRAQVSVLERSLWLQCGNRFVAETNQGAGPWIRR